MIKDSSMISVEPLTKRMQTCDDKFKRKFRIANKNGIIDISFKGCHFFLSTPTKMKNSYDCLRDTEKSCYYKLVFNRQWIGFPGKTTIFVLPVESWNTGRLTFFYKIILRKEILNLSSVHEEQVYTSKAVNDRYMVSFLKNSIRHF